MDTPRSLHLPSFLLLDQNDWLSKNVVRKLSFKFSGFCEWVFYSLRRRDPCPWWSSSHPPGASAPLTLWCDLSSSVCFHFCWLKRSFIFFVIWEEEDQSINLCDLFGGRKKNMSGDQNSQSLLLDLLIQGPRVLLNKESKLFLRIENRDPELLDCEDACCCFFTQPKAFVPPTSEHDTNWHWRLNWDEEKSDINILQSSRDHLELKGDFMIQPPSFYPMIILEVRMNWKIILDRDSNPQKYWCRGVFLFESKAGHWSSLPIEVHKK